MNRSVTGLACLVLLTGCAGRVPGPERAQKIVAKHFEKYGDRYKWSDFGQYPVERVEVTEIQEIQKGIAEIVAYTYLAEGGPVHKVRLQVEKKALRWKTVGWENLATSR